MNKIKRWLRKDKTGIILDSGSDAYDENLDGTAEDKIDLTEGQFHPAKHPKGVQAVSTNGTD
jgi:hypothetical protein